MGIKYTTTCSDGPRLGPSSCAKLFSSRHTDPVTCVYLEQIPHLPPFYRTPRPGTSPTVSSASGVAMSMRAHAHTPDIPLRSLRSLPQYLLAHEYAHRLTRRKRSANASGQEAFTQLPTSEHTVCTESITMAPRVLTCAGTTLSGLAVVVQMA